MCFSCLSLLFYSSNSLLRILFSLCIRMFSSTCRLFVTHLLQFHSGLEGFDSLSPAALYETPPEQAAAAPRTDWFPGIPAPICGITSTSQTVKSHRLVWKNRCVTDSDTHLKAASSSDSTVFSLSDAVSCTTSAALSRASSDRLRPASSKATSLLWPSPLARLNSDPREVTSPQSCQQKPKKKTFT